MVESQFDNRPKSINVAIATDTILYAPFFMAYYGGDFNDTPFGKFTINIIGKEEDNRFKTLKLKGDGFATFCTVLGLSDISICDPSFIIFLKTCSVDDLKELCEEFFKILTDYGMSSVIKKNPTLFNHLKQLIPEELRKAIETDKQIVGGLISKLAFSVVGNIELQEIQKNNNYKGVELFGSNPLTDDATQKFTKEHIKQFIFYDRPSTGNCFGKIYADIYSKNEVGDSPYQDFGKELVFLTETAIKPSFAFSCDYVAIDYRKDIIKIEEEKEKKVVEIKDFTKSSDGYLFTGFIGNTKQANQNKLKGFLYSIDKNLYEIDYYLKNEEITGLVNFIKSKLPREKDMLTYILKMLVADSECFELIKAKIKKEDDPFSLDNVIGMYAKRLSEWQAYGKENNLGLYYNSTKINEQAEEDLVRIYTLRKKAYKNGTIQPAEFEIISKSIASDFLGEWRKEEDEIIHLNHNANLKSTKKYKWQVFFLGLLSPLFFIYMILNFIKIKKLPLRTFFEKQYEKNKIFIWSLLSKPTFLFWVGAIFILFEILTGIAHITGAHVNDWPKPIIPILNININIIINIIFTYLTIIILVSVITGYSLIRNKQSEKFVYRHE